MKLLTETQDGLPEKIGFHLYEKTNWRLYSVLVCDILPLFFLPYHWLTQGLPLHDSQRSGDRTLKLSNYDWNLWALSVVHY